jgi:hypothetical protein
MNNIYAYINLETLEYPIFRGDMKLLFPELSNEIICPENYAEVYDVPSPKKSSTQKIMENKPIKNNGIWMRQFEIVEIEPRTESFSAIRKPASQRETKIFATATTGRIPVYIIE